ncbi:uncharacterized protein BDCG_17473 [Blastomyces dermatitidis ER-3]|uniref:Uncharacterized protein n=1 Tax=Ajellomyces dermatitidis (strain ER-3 / ATCC MYA-2586) TaxID=559297 RepID=A0ABX2VYR0_AJEDR|nr:uncharacterized protein BDCG_17473 [Blastomyces dermatitidis ER-3]OAT02272.1 hypothetical protein BDCG_17473 [Blastomyces dermatitidis ER-3]
MTSASLVRISELQVLMNSVKAEEVPLAHLQKEMKVAAVLTSQQAKMSVPETLTVKNEFGEDVVVDE